MKFTLSLIVPALTLFFSLGFAAPTDTGSDYSDYSSCDYGFMRCYEVLGIAEGCGWNPETYAPYSSDVSDQTVGDCICNTPPFYPAVYACAAALPTTEGTYFTQEMESICYGTYDHTTYDHDDKTVYKRAPDLTGLTAITKATGGKRA